MSLFGRRTTPVCPLCKKNATRKQCPGCEAELPSGIDELSDVTIAVIGAKEVGKSHYIAVLIDQIKRLYRSFGWTLRASNDETIDLYDRLFYKPLFENRVTIRETQSALGNQNVRKPLIYSLRLGRQHQSKTIMLAFFDTAGEDLNSEDVMAKVNRYIYNASGIILLLDPLQLKSVRESFEEKDLPAVNTEMNDIVDRTVRLIQNGRGLRADTRIDIPLAVAFSKMDVMRGRSIMGEDAEYFFRPSGHKGDFSRGEMRRTDQIVRRWVERYDARCLHGLGSFTDTAFFGVSALGCNPQATQRLDFAPRPARVEDPFLWILWKNKLIKSIQ